MSEFDFQLILLRLLLWLKRLSKSINLIKKNGRKQTLKLFRKVGEEQKRHMSYYYLHLSGLEKFGKVC